MAGVGRGEGGACSQGGSTHQLVLAAQRCLPTRGAVHATKPQRCTPRLVRPAAGQLQRQLQERDSRLQAKEREMQQLRTRIERMTAELSNTHAKVGETSAPGGALGGAI